MLCKRNNSQSGPGIVCNGGHAPASCARLASDAVSKPGEERDGPAVSSKSRKQLQLRRTTYLEPIRVCVMLRRRCR